jgi:hypothetical protein
MSLASKSAKNAALRLDLAAVSLLARELHPVSAFTQLLRVKWARGEEEEEVTMRIQSNWAALTALSLAATVAFAGCDVPEEDVEDLPEVSEVERDGDTGAMELEKELMLGPEDEGETIIATGWVEGRPLENGFFLRTDYDRVVFIESENDVSSGDAVRVEGLVKKSEAESFNQWEREALGEDLDPDWEFWRGIYLDAHEVNEVEGATPNAVKPDETPRY